MCLISVLQYSRNLCCDETLLRTSVKLTGKDIFGCYRIFKIHHRFHNRPWLDACGSGIQSTFSHTISLRTVLILSSYLLLYLANGFVSWGFPTNFCISYFIHAAYPSCITILILKTLTISINTIYEDAHAHLHPSVNFLIFKHSTQYLVLRYP